MLGCVILESLENTTPLNDLRPVLREVEHHPDDPDATTWNVHWYRRSREEALALAAELAQVIRRNWYAHFFSETELIMVLSGRVFCASTSDRSTWEPFIAYGRTVGVPPSLTGRVPLRPPGQVQ